MQLSITSHARLHLGFIDFHGGLGRRFGGWGIALRTPSNIFTMGGHPPVSTDSVDTQSALVAEMVARFDRHFSTKTNDPIYISKVIPHHQGLGSGTQTALTVGHLLSRWHKIPLKTAEIASAMRRGLRSGIGVGTYDLGGVIIDGGKSVQSETDRVPPVVARCNFPEKWRIVLLHDPKAHMGLHGSSEQQVFTRLPDFSAQHAGDLSRLVLMQLLPAIVEEDFSAFADAVTQFQSKMGKYFAPFQGGMYGSRVIRSILEKLTSAGVNGTGQTSWGPTAFAFAVSEQHAQNLADTVNRFSSGEVRSEIVSAANQGSRLKVRNNL